MGVIKEETSMKIHLRLIVPAAVFLMCTAASVQTTEVDSHITAAKCGTEFPRYLR
jgi:hypothetical protein